MPDITLSSASLIRGEELSVTLHGFPAADFDQVQLEIISAGVLNPSSRLGIGTSPDRGASGSVSVVIDSRPLDPGYYEVGLVRLHTPTKAPDSSKHIDFIPGKGFERQVFEIRADDSEPKDGNEVLARVVELEQKLEEKFREPVDLSDEESEQGDRFRALVFLQDVLLGVRMRFECFEIIPTHSGLAREDELQFVNDFLRQAGTGIQFVHHDDEKNLERQRKPVAVLHFPSLVAIDPETVCDYCAREAETLLLALALSRDAGGMVFDIVVINVTTGEAKKFGITKPYVGNLLTGSLSGEKAGQVHTYMKGIAVSDMNRFLVSLYREARRERSRDFQYVRLWQLLETMADARDYDPSQPLLDYEDNPVMKSGRPRHLKGSVHTVFNLLRENQIGNTEQTWRHVNVWFAFRTAVAHHGAISRYDELLRKSVREWARKGFEEIQDKGGFDPYLMTLKEDAKLLLMRRLVKAARTKATA